MEWTQELHDAAKLGVAYALALPVGWYREKEAHSVGLRTFPVVAMASCGYVLLARSWAHPSLDAEARVIQGVVAGIGFVGAGAILKSENHVHGTATAASIWNIAALGAAVAMEHYLIAIMLALLNFVALVMLAPVKRVIDGDLAGQSTSRVKPAHDD
jgi:putative Mg2+ transporter-C (MgtC) family protein